MLILIIILMFGYLVINQTKVLTKGKPTKINPGNLTAGSSTSPTW